MTGFRQYEGWENDLRFVVDVLSPDAQEMTGCLHRLRAAFEPEECGAVLHFRLSGSPPKFEYQVGPTVSNDRNQIVSRPITCRLPKGHHLYNPETCLKPANDPIHSAGHIADVPPEAWR